MKFQTDFDKRIKDVYDIIALPYPPKTINSDAGALEEEFPEEETTVELKPFKQKTQSYNIHNETLTCRKATKTLSSFITECERKRRENEDKNVKGRDYLKQKEDVIHFINVLSEKAKDEKTRRDSLTAAKLKETKVNMLGEMRRFSNAVQADKDQLQEQKRRVSVSIEQQGLEQMKDMVSQLAPIHEQLASAFNQTGGNTGNVLRKISSESLVSAPSVQRIDEVNMKMNKMMRSVTLNDENDVPEYLEGNVVQGAGQIGRTLKKGSKTFQKQISQVAESNRRMSVVQGELLSNIANKADKKEDKKHDSKRHHKDSMDFVLDSVVRKVQGKDVVKQKKDEIRKERQKIARQDTFEKIKDYGKRKEVLENADTSYVHTTIPDERTVKAKKSALKDINAMPKKESEKSVSVKPPKVSSKKPSNPALSRLAHRRPTGPPSLLAKGVAGLQKPAPAGLKPVPETGKGPSKSPSAIRRGTGPPSVSPSTLRKGSAPAKNSSPGSSPRGTTKAAQGASPPIWR